MNTNVSGIPTPRRRRTAAACEAATGGTRATRRGVSRCPGGIRRDLRATVTRRDGRTAVVEVAGEIDVHTSGELRTVLMALADEGGVHIVADFTGVRFCDAAGLGALVAVNNRTRGNGGSLSLTGVRPAQRRILQITRLDHLFRSDDSVDGAIAT
ncbi:STAS domain-containing protein [Actinoallomurus bryophytorum]|uniref:STAS domain-containing protein n=1 Tax=Actinoallomurus bryophytorum TaxID=1490222 RepID=UPI00115433C6|nr:STAS domain-containing protein [Actinoallomurus bryophytorum]